MKLATAPIEAKAHGAWLGAGSGVALAQIIVGVVQAITRRPLDPGFIAAIDGVTSPLLALLGAWLAPHTPRLLATPLAPDPTMAQMARWFRDRGIDVQFGTAPATDATGNFLPAAQPNAPGAVTDPFAPGQPVNVTPGQEYRPVAMASPGSPPAVRAVDVMASPQPGPVPEGGTTPA